MAAFDITGLTKRFQGHAAVDDVSLSVSAGAFVALLGPSGCGKTTLLRLLAGLERPDAGTIAIADRVVAGPSRFIEPEDRSLGMVFQSYALWPHMSVGGNVEFGLKVQGLPRSERRAAVASALAAVGLAGLTDRRPHELSGGQRQRVALARSLALRPSLILLDEPLANLDAALRDVMLGEFRRIHREANTTFVFVTHDQNEAMALADTVAVMDHGRLQQVAAPRTLYERPQTAMVARFVGQGRTLPVEILGEPDGSGLQAVRLGPSVLRVSGATPAGAGWLCVRPSGLAVAAQGEGNAFAGTVVDQRYGDGAMRIEVAVEGVPDAVVELHAPMPIEAGTRLFVAIRNGWLLAREDASVIRHANVKEGA